MLILRERSLVNKENACKKWHNTEEDTLIGYIFIRRSHSVETMNKYILLLVRWLVGLLFIFSGLVKANDPLGLSYKMQEFFEVWGWHGLAPYTLGLSILMIAFEIVAGVAVILGWQMRLFAWLLLLLILFFTFLTGYAVFSGKIKTCGCFGDCIPLTALQSFYKDLFLLAAILFLFYHRKQIQPTLNTRVSVVLLILATVLSFDAQWYVLKHLPFVDCLPYKKDSRILEQMKAPPGSIPDSTVISFVYKKAGQQVEFTADQFPDDFDDSVYQFVSRYDKVVRPGNASPPIKDFMMQPETGVDTTQAWLSVPGKKWLLVTSGLSDTATAWRAPLQGIYQSARQSQTPFVVLTSQQASTAAWMQASGMGDALLLKCDYVAIKTAARTNPTLYLLDGDRILQKWGYADFNKVKP
jgi:uncharacterized membrane protein YphA (DoxX/SURF4 family)